MSKYLEEGKDYYYAFPLQHIIVPEYGIDIRHNYGYCSMYFPESLQTEKAMGWFYLIKVYKYFTAEIDQSIDHILAHPLIFGETLHLLYHPPQRGEAKWIKLGKRDVSIRKRKDIPDLKTSSIALYIPYKERTWWLLKNGGFLHDWSKYKVNYKEVEELEYGDAIGMFTVTERIYLLLILEHLSIHKIPPPEREKMEKIMFPIMRKEPVIKRWDDAKLKDEVFNFLDLYYGEFIDRFQWDR